jgi:hypothetical protein
MKWKLPVLLLESLQFLEALEALQSLEAYHRVV